MSRTVTLNVRDTERAGLPLSVTWIVMDVSALVGSLAARLGALRDDKDLIVEGGRLVRYVVSKQTSEGAWFYAEPPSASHMV